MLQVGCVFLALLGVNFLCLMLPIRWSFGPSGSKTKKTKNKHITHKLTTNRTWQLVWGPKAIHGTAFKGTPLFSQTGSKQRRETKLKPQPLQAGFLCGGISTTCPWGLHHLDGPTDLPPAESFLTWCHYVSLDVLELMM